MTTKSTSEVWNDIIGVTGPLEKTLKALSENPNGTDTGRAQAGENYKVVNQLNTSGAQLAAQATLTHTQSHGMGPGRSRASSSDSTRSDDRNK